MYTTHVLSDSSSVEVDAIVTWFMGIATELAKNARK